MKYTNNSMVKRAALYIRVSSEEQAMHGLSLAAQREALESYAREHGYKVVGLYADEGITARKKYKNRTQFMRMLSDVENGLLDVILFIKLDRWFRNIADYYEVQRILDANHVEWIATEERYDTTTANGRLNLNIRLSIAQDESDRTAERIKFVFADKIRRGEVVSGKVPLGYKIENKKMVPDPSTVHIAQDLFTKYIDLRSVQQLRRYAMDTYGLVYTPTGMSMLLRNERYVGKAHGDPNFCEGIIPPAVFARAQYLAKERAQRSTSKYPDRVYLFSSIVFCAECGNRLNGHVVAGKYIYYRCTKYEKLHLCTHKKKTSELILERYALEHLYEAFEEYNAEILSMRGQPRPQVDIPRIKAKMEKLKDLYLNDLIDRDMYETDYRNLQKALEVHDYPVIERTPVDLDHVKELTAAYSSLDRPNKKKFWSNVVDRIVIDNDENIKIYPAHSLPYYN